MINKSVWKHEENEKYTIGEKNNLDENVKKGGGQSVWKQEWKICWLEKIRERERERVRGGKCRHMAVIMTGNREWYMDGERKLDNGDVQATGTWWRTGGEICVIQMKMQIQKHDDKWR